SSASPLLSSGPRWVAHERKATKRPSALSVGLRLWPFPPVPALSTLTRSVVPVRRSWTNTSGDPLVSPGTRFVEREVNATNQPSALSARSRCVVQGLGYPFSWFPALSTLTRSVVPACGLGTTARRSRTVLRRARTAILLASVSVVMLVSLWAKTPGGR